MKAACELLGETQDLERAHCDRLLELMLGLTNIEWFCSTSAYVMVAVAFGRACGDPAPYLPRLMQVFRAAPICGGNHTAAVVLAEIAGRRREA